MWQPFKGFFRVFATSSLSAARSRWVLFALVVIGSLLGSLLAVVSPPAPAHAEVTGTGGQYVPMTGNARVYSGTTGANGWKTIKVAGVDGLPASDIGAVTLMIQVNDVNGQGQMVGRPDTSTPDTLVLIYGAGVSGNASDSALLAVGANGSIQLKTETAQTRVTVDVTGYYTSTKNGVTGGGYVPVSPALVADTRDGTGVRQAQVGAGGKITFQVTGKGGIPQGAAAAQVGVFIRSEGGASGAIRVYPSTGAGSSGRLSYSPEKVNTSVSAQVALGTDGKLSIDNTTGGATLDLVVNVQGYFTPSNPGGGFTPTTGRLADTRTGASITSGSSVAVQVAGIQSVPTVEAGLVAAALTVTTVNQDTRDASAKVWADGAAEPGVTTTFSENGSIQTTTVIAPVGKNGVVRIKNQGAGTVNYVVDLQGYYNSLPGGPASTNLTGQRTSATRLPFPITDQTSASVDVGTGNLMVSTAALSLPGVTSSTPIGAAYNSRSTREANTNTMDANRWTYGLAGAGDLSANALGVVYTDANGTAWQFKRLGQGTFTTPAGLQQTLTRTLDATDEYQLKGWTTNATTHFNLAGQPTSVVDRNGNQVGFNYDGVGNFRLNNIQSTAGAVGAKTLKSSYANGVQTFTQTGGSSARPISWAKNADGDIITYTDATGKQTTFGYTNGDLTSITAPEGGVTAFSYDSSDRVTKVEQRNTSAGSAGTAVTRFSYASDTSTLVADPRSDQSKAVADAAHTTYTLDGNDLVTKAVDAANREQSRSYKSTNNGVASSTVGTGSSGSTSTNAYDANDGQSLTSSQSASGSTSSAEYGSSAPTAYLPSSTTDSSKNKTSYGYDGPGNQTSTGTGSGPEAATAKLEYNKQGTDANAWGAVKTATAPGNDGNPTKYGYDANNQLTSIVPPTGTSLGEQKYAYDDFGRVKTHTDGGGGVTTYTYDNNDRLLTTGFDDGTATVTNTYDGNGNLLTEQSATGTITNSYDQRNRLTSTVNTAGGGQVSYGYDLAGNTVKVTDQHGTVTHDYDAANVLVKTTYPTANGGTGKQVYKNDDHGRRTDAWLGANTDSDPTSWQAHQTITYGASDKVTRVQAWQASDTSKPVVDLQYCYITGITAGSDCSATKSANDTDKIQWAKDNVTGQTTTYTYDSNSRLTKAAQASGAKNTTWAYTYDVAGNRLTAKASGDTTSSQTLTYNAVGQITTTGYEYDGTGNLTKAPGQTFTYNGAQQLTTSVKDGVTTSYEYAGADMNKLLSQATAGGAEYDYTYGTSDRNGVPVTTGRTIAGTGTASVISDPTTGQPLDLQTTDGITSMWIVDGTGSPAAAIADTGKTAYTVSYAPYGGETVGTGGGSAQWKQNPYGFKSGIRSSSTDNGLTKFGFRWQSSAIGGWIERDTLDAPLSPTNANRYAYAGTDPMNSADPTGMVNCYFQPLTAAAAVPAAQRIGAGAFNYVKKGAIVAGSGLGIGIAAGSATIGSFIYLAKVDDCLGGGRPSNVYVGSNSGNAASPGY